MRSFIKVDDFSKEEIYAILNRANYLQECWKNNTMPQTLKDEKIALWFFGQGFRNRVAFELGARSLGADVSFIPGDLGIHEPIEDIAHYLNNWFSMAVIRCLNHDDLLKVVNDSKFPVINARTSFNHPCEIIGDLQFIHNKRGSIDGLNVVFIGEVTNLCMSWFEAARVLPIQVAQIGPEGYLCPSAVVAAMNVAAVGNISVSSTMEGFIDKGTDVLYTDCWPKSKDKEKIKQEFLPYQITKKLVDAINRNGFYMPCPPITRGEELSEDSLAAIQYCDYQAKEYLLHSQNAIMEFCIKGRS
jgi:ornithine carbamoyltransferase